LAADFGTGFRDAEHPDFRASRVCPETYPLRNRRGRDAPVLGKAEISRAGLS
jgi:hypothetical protein